MKKGLFFITTICILTACGPSQSEFDRLKEENTILIAQVDSLNKELVKYQYSPAKILAEAKQIWVLHQQLLAKQLGSCLIESWFH